MWFMLDRCISRKDNHTKLLLGLCHDRIFYLGMGYIRRGWVTPEELTNLQKYLSEPYFKLGGNGVVKRIMDEVFKLPIKDVKDVTSYEMEGSW